MSADLAVRFRAQLGLPASAAGVPVIAAGHQAEFWHAGILAKIFAAQAAAEQARTARGVAAVVAWLVVDQDITDAFAMDVPVLDPRGRVRVRRWVPDASHAGLGLPAMSVPAISPPTKLAALTLPEGWRIAPGIAERFERVRAALSAHAGAPDAVEQSARAQFELLGLRDVVIVRASAMARTELFAQVLARARARPQTLHEVYNAAVARVPGSGVRALSRDVPGYDGLELPFWVVEPSGRRRAAFEGDLRGDPPEPGVRLLPRGLLATGLMRLAGCELFVHGTGGAAYEPINDLWLSRWLDLEAAAPALAPFASATADAYLDLPGSGVTSGDAARARWRAHHAKHHPGELGDAGNQREREAIVAQLAAAPARSAERAALFRALHTLRAEHQRRNAAALAALRAQAEDLHTAAAGEGVRARRDFAAVLHDPRAIDALRAAIDAQLPS